MYYVNSDCTGVGVVALGLVISQCLGRPHSVAIQQLIREWPWLQGIERVAHELGNVWRGDVFSLDVQGQAYLSSDALPVAYPRRRLRSINVFSRLYLPLPSRSLISLLFSSEPLHGHCLRRGFDAFGSGIFTPRRIVMAHWHCFLETKQCKNGRLLGFYQWCALRILPSLFAVVTTSPALSVELQHCCFSPAHVVVLPCCLGATQEQSALAVPLPMSEVGEPMRVLFVGRLDSYKRLDWLLKSLRHFGRPGGCRLLGMDPNAVVFNTWHSSCSLDSFKRILSWSSSMDAYLSRTSKSR